MAVADTEGDEAYARQLQAIENGVRPGPHPAAPHHHGEDGPPRNVRAHMAGQVAQNATRNHKLNAIIATCIGVPQLLAIMIGLSAATAPFDTCFRISLWLVIMMFRFIMVISRAWTFYYYRGATQHEYNCLMKFFLRTYSSIQTLYLVWFVFGNLWILGGAGGASECKDASPLIYWLGFSVLMVDYLMLCFPCLLVLLLVPVALFCMPCLLRIIGRVNDPMRGKGAAEKDIKKLKAEKYRAGLLKEDSPTCAVCITEYEEGEDIRILPCAGGHHYHKECIDEWLKINATCPSCRERIIGEDPTAPPILAPGEGGGGGGGGGSGSGRPSTADGVSAPSRITVAVHGGSSSDDDERGVIAHGSATAPGGPRTGYAALRESD